jgi:hypothetical protein
MLERGPCSETKTRFQVVKARSLASAALHFRCRYTVSRYGFEPVRLSSSLSPSFAARLEYEYNASVSDVEHPAGTCAVVLQVRSLTTTAQILLFVLLGGLAILTQCRDHFWSWLVNPCASRVQPAVAACGYLQPAVRNARETCFQGRCREAESCDTELDRVTSFTGSFPVECKTICVMHISVLRNATVWLCGDREGCEIAQQEKGIPCLLVRSARST